MPLGENCVSNWYILEQGCTNPGRLIIFPGAPNIFSVITTVLLIYTQKCVSFTCLSPPPPFALRPNAGHGLLIVEVSSSHTDASQSVGLLWTRDQLVAGTST